MGCCNGGSQGEGSSVVQVQGVSDWVGWFFRHVDDFEQLASILGKLASDLPIGLSASAAGEPSAVSAAVQSAITAEAKARGITGERLKKLLEIVGPIAEKYLLPWLLSQIKLSAAALD